MNEQEKSGMLKTICELWTELNPHGQVHGCRIAANGDVCLYIWYRFIDSLDGNTRIAPIEICIGNEAMEVVDLLKMAVSCRTIKPKQRSQRKSPVQEK